MDLPRIYAAIAYYLANKAVIDADIEADTHAIEQLEAEERAAQGT